MRNEVVNRKFKLFSAKCISAHVNLQPHIPCLALSENSTKCQLARVSGSLLSGCGLRSWDFGLSAKRQPDGLPQSAYSPDQDRISTASGQPIKASKRLHSMRVDRQLFLSEGLLTGS